MINSGSHVVICHVPGILWMLYITLSYLIVSKTQRNAILNRRLRLTELT